MGSTEIILIVALPVLLIGMFFYSNFAKKKRNAQMEDMVNKLTVGAKVQTAGGIIGIITEVNEIEGTITIETGTSTITFNKQVVYPHGYFAKPNPAAVVENSPEEQAIIDAEINEDFQLNENTDMDTLNSDFIDVPKADAGEPAEAKKPKTRKAKKSSDDTAKFE